MKILSVNIGIERELQTATSLSRTGIHKVPVSGAVYISAPGLKDDIIVSKKHHGGPDQAVYVFGAEDYAYWSVELGDELAPGTFGENLTISDMQSAEFNIGDRLQAGEVTLEVTAPRIPCGTLAARMGDPQFVKKYRDVERPGFYCRVIAEGEVKAGDVVTVQRSAGEAVGILEVFRHWYEKEKDESTLGRFLNAPIATRVRKRLEDDLQKLLERNIP